MRQVQGVLLLSGLLVLLGGCGSTSVGTDSGTVAATVNGTTATMPTVPPKASPTSDTVTGSDNSVVSTASVGGSVSVAVGASQTISVVFSSSDGKAITGFAVSGSLNSLPTGWSAPSSFACAAVGPGSGCVLTLTYSPVALGSGTLVLNCVFVDNANTPRTPGPCLTIDYASTAANNVVATPSLAGEVDAVIGAGAQALNVNFTTDDGNPATALVLTTDLGSLPAGWSSSASSFNCPIVRVGSGCQLPLSFSPSATARATLSLSYAYLDSAGTARTAAINIPYASVSTGTVVATSSPSGQINAIEATGASSVALTFNTIDGKGAASLALITDLSSLPAGWSSTSNAISCTSVSTGNGCQLHLKYAPQALTSGTITLRYAYTDAGGAANTGLVDVSYAATTDDNIVYALSNGGELDATVGSSQSEAVLFTTDDGRVATGLQITSSLTALPAGWSSSVGAFGCVAVASGAGCQLNLSYAPMADDSSTLALGFSYVNNAGETRTGTVTIQYRATADDSLVATSNPMPVAATVGSSNPVSVTFTTTDGNPATSLSADLSMLPADWSTSSSMFTCSTFDTGNGCTLSLTYAPTAPANSTLSFSVGYTNNAGTASTTTVSIPYTAQ